MEINVFDDEKLIEAVSGFYSDPLGFVLFVFPWGEEGGKLADKYPDEWQIKVLKELGEGTLTATEAVRIAVASGHGIGKSALVSWIILWFISTRPHPQIVVTANTKGQLETKTWRELSKWQKLAINSHWFEWTATKFYLKAHPETWFAACVPWSKERSEAFAGTHEDHVLVVFDEASLIDDSIWEVAEGAMTTKGAFWVCFGNPTRNTGRFRECFGRFRHRWAAHQVDSRTAKMTNKSEIDQWKDDYGEDSDFFRVRVKGEFPRASSMQFIALDSVRSASERAISEKDIHHSSIVFGVDVARYGDDMSVICIRKGQAVLEIKKYRELNTMELSSVVSQAISEYRPAAVFIDSGAMGAGVVDRLRQLGFRVTEVNFGSRAADDKHYANKRAEMWGRMREWLKTGSLPADKELMNDLTAPEYSFDMKERIILERKEDMKKRGLASPDSADALALTFAEYVADKNNPLGTANAPKRGVTDYNIFS